MASLARSSILRQGPAASQRMFSTAACAAVRRPLAQQLRPVFEKSTRVAAFHATQRNQILPPLPQKIDGTANDPVPIPEASPTHGNYHWSFERWVHLLGYARGHGAPILD